MLLWKNNHLLEMNEVVLLAAQWIAGGRNMLIQWPIISQ